MFVHQLNKPPTKENINVGYLVAAWCSGNTLVRST